MSIIINQTMYLAANHGLALLMVTLDGLMCWNRNLSGAISCTGLPWHCNLAFLTLID